MCQWSNEKEAKYPEPGFERGARSVFVKTIDMKTKVQDLIEKGLVRTAGTRPSVYVTTVMKRGKAAKKGNGWAISKIIPT